MGCAVEEASVRRESGNFDAVAVYYTEIGRIPLLTPDAERATFARLERLRRWRDALRETLEFRGVSFDGDRPLPPENPSLQERVRRYLALTKAVEKVRGSIAQANLRLAVVLAKKYQGRGLSLADLIQEANIGLLRAIDRFEVRRGVRFAAYAAWWIQQALGIAIFAHGRMVRLPAYLQERQRRLRLAMESSHKTTTVAELADSLGITSVQAQRALDADVDTLSLDTPLSFHSRATVGELLAAPRERQPDCLVEYAEMVEHVERLFADLDPRTEKILRLRYGFEDGVARSLQEVGEVMNLSRERVRQIEKRAFQRFRTRGNIAQLRALI